MDLQQLTRAAPLTAGATAVYRLYDAAGRLLYVGIAANPFTRWIEHAREKPWWHEVTHLSIGWRDDRAAALAEESQAIVEEAPAYNIAGNPRVQRPVALSPSRHATPRRVIGIDDPVWERLEEMYGDRNRAAVLRQAAAWLARMPGAKLPERPPPPAAQSEPG